jgi:uncharacterized protein YqhQ
MSGTNGSVDPSSNGAPAAGDEPLRLGGMALRNGLLIHGPSSWAVAARSAAGTVEVAAGPKPDFGGNRFARVPLLRGPLRLAEAFAVIPLARRSLPSARLPFEDPRVILGALGASALGNLSLAGEPGPAREGAAATLGLLPALIALTGSELAAYHGVEHKAIAAYEQGEDDPARVPKEHDRCGSNLIAPLLAFSVAGQLIVERLFEKPGRIARGASALGALSLAVETFVFAERNPDSPLGRALHRSGYEIQRVIATREPTPEQLEVGIAALDAVLAEEAERTPG